LKRDEMLALRKREGTTKRSRIAKGRRETGKLALLAEADQRGGTTKWAK
jgi:hypothetical protein